MISESAVIGKSLTGQGRPISQPPIIIKTVQNACLAYITSNSLKITLLTIWCQKQQNNTMAKKCVLSLHYIKQALLNTWCQKQ
jgi:hypothetical protein